MIEFTLSRVAVIICGVIMLGAVFAPVSALFEEEEADGMAAAADHASAILDRFWESETDVLTLRGSDILPGPGCRLEIAGQNVSLIDSSGKEYRTAVAHGLESFVLSYNDVVELTRNGSSLELLSRRRLPPLSSARPRTGRCPRDCCRGTPTPARCPRSRGPHGTDGRSAYPSGP